MAIRFESHKTIPITPFSKPAAKVEVDAEWIAIKALEFLAGNENLFLRFVENSGVQAETLVENASSTDFQLGILNFLNSNNERDLISFCNMAGIKPDIVASAIEHLSKKTD